MIFDPKKRRSDYRDVKWAYNSMMRRYINAENAVNASLILTQKINEAKEIVEKEGIISSAETDNIIDFDKPIKFVKKFLPSSSGYDADINDGEVAATPKKFRRPPGLPEKQISMDYDAFDSANELNP